jgi:hypothetical protein
MHPNFRRSGHHPAYRLLRHLPRGTAASTLPCPHAQGEIAPPGTCITVTEGLTPSDGEVTQGASKWRLEEI